MTIDYELKVTDDENEVITIARGTVSSVADLLRVVEDIEDEITEWAELEGDE